MSFLPVMKEGKSKFYLPLRSTIGSGIALALLFGSIGGAMYYPTMKTNEIEKKLNDINAFTAEYLARANEVINTVSATVDAIDDATDKHKMKPVYIKQLNEYRTRISAVSPLDKEEILRTAKNQQAAFDEAQALIKSSPFKDMDQRFIPPTEDGQAYKAALEAVAPPKYEYVQIHHAIAHAAQAMQQAGQQLNLMANYQKTMRAKLDPERAKAELAAEVAAQAERDAKAARLKGRFQFEAPEATATAATGRQAAQPAAQLAPPSDHARDLEAANKALVAGFTGKSVEQVSPEQKLLNDLEAQENKAKAEAERKEQQAKAEAERKQRTAQQAAARAEQQKKREAQQAKERAENQARQAQQQAERQQRDAQRAAEAKARECTKSIASRLTCTAQGYNPVTGYKMK